MNHSDGRYLKHEVASEASKQGCKVFVGGLSWDTTDTRLRAYFENYGIVKEAFVSYCRESGKPRGFGFVVFDSPAVADRVVQHKHTIDRREVDAKHAMPRAESTGARPMPQFPDEHACSAGSRKIFVGGLPANVTDALLRQHFDQFGEIEDAVVMMDHQSKRSRGFGFVSFVNEASVDHVLRMDSRPVLYGKAVEVKRAVPRDQISSDPYAGRRRLGGMYPMGMHAPPYSYPYGAHLPPPSPYAGYGHALHPFGSPPPPAERDLHHILQQVESARSRPRSGPNWHFAAPLSDSTMPDHWPDGRSMVPPLSQAGGVRVAPAPRPGSHDSMLSAHRMPAPIGRAPASVASRTGSSGGMHAGSASELMRMDMMPQAYPGNSGPLDGELMHGGPLDSMVAALGSALPAEPDAYAAAW